MRIPRPSHMRVVTTAPTPCCLNAPDR
jgi:hypothetical protein